MAPEPTDLSTPLPPADVFPLSLTPSLQLNPSSKVLLLQREQKAPQINQQLFQQHIFPWSILATIVLVATVAMGLSYVASRYLTYQRRPTPPVPPVGEAFEALKRLESSHLPSRGEFDSYYVQLTSIIRRYIERQASIPASTQTTQEFLAAAAQAAQLNAEARQILDDLLTYADQVKFAQRSSTEADCSLAFSYASEFLRMTS